VSADLKTLRLASLQLSPERLDAFMTYQRTLLSELRAATAPDWSGKYAFAHGKALAASKLDLVEMGKLKSLVAEYCGKRSAVQAVKDRVEQAKTGGSPKDAQVLERAKKELHKLDDLRPFTERYGDEATRLLQAREAELLQLHRELAKAEGTGHLHPEARPS
jgi:hypothetical protein